MSFRPDISFDTFYWKSLGKHIRWSNVSKFMKLRIAQTFSFIPIIGYWIIWSDRFREYFKMFGKDGSLIWSDSEMRIEMVYFGSFFMLIAFVIYLVRCPAHIKSQPDIDEFVALFDQSTPKTKRNSRSKENSSLVEPEPDQVNARLVDRDGMLLKSTDDFDGFSYTSNAGRFLRCEYSANTVGYYSRPDKESRNILIIHFLQSEDDKYFSILACVSFLLVGFSMVLIPSIEVFIYATSVALS